LLEESLLIGIHGSVIGRHAEDLLDDLGDGHLGPRVSRLHLADVLFHLLHPLLVHLFIPLVHLHGTIPASWRHSRTRSFHQRLVVEVLEDLLEVGFHLCDFLVVLWVVLEVAVTNLEHLLDLLPQLEGSLEPPLLEPVVDQIQIQKVLPELFKPGMFGVQSLCEETSARVSQQQSEDSIAALLGVSRVLTRLFLVLHAVRARNLTVIHVITHLPNPIHHLPIVYWLFDPLASDFLVRVLTLELRLGLDLHLLRLFVELFYLGTEFVGPSPILGRLQPITPFEVYLFLLVLRRFIYLLTVRFASFILFDDILLVIYFETRW